MRYRHGGLFVRLRRHRDAVALACLLAVACLVRADTAYAAGLGVTAPLVENNGVHSCPTCTTNAASLTSNGVVIGQGSQATKVVSLNSTGTKKYLQQTSSGEPTFDQPVITELQAFSSANLASVLSDEVGNSGGFTRGTAGSNGNLAAWDANGNLVDGGSATSIKARHPFGGITSVEITSSSAFVYVGLDGCVSLTESDCETPMSGTGSFTSLNVFATAATGQAITCILGVGAHGSVSYSSKAQCVLSTSAFTAGTISGTTSWTDGQVVVGRCGIASGAANKVSLRGSYSQSAGS